MKNKIKGTFGSKFLSHFGRFWIGTLIVFIDILCTFVVVMTSCSYLFPLFSAFISNAMGLPDVNSSDAYIFIGSSIAVSAVVFGAGVVFLLKKIYLKSMRLYVFLCDKVKIKLEGNKVKNTNQVISSKATKFKVIITIVCVIILVLIVFLGFYLNSSDDKIVSADDISPTLLPVAREYPLISDTDVGDNVESVDLSEWTETDTSDALNNIFNSINEFGQTLDYSSRVRLGMDSNNPSEDGVVLSNYIRADMIVDLTQFIPGGNFENGNCLYLDSEYKFIQGDANDVSSNKWYISNMTYGTNFELDKYVTLYDNGKTFSSNYDLTDGSKPYIVVDSTGDSYVDSLTFSFLQAMFTNISVPANDIVVYSRENEYGVSYYFESTNSSITAGYDSLTKRVLFDCVGDGEYSLEFDYILNKDDNFSRFVFDIDLDTTDIEIDVPSVDDALYVVNSKD